MKFCVRFIVFIIVVAQVGCGFEEQRKQLDAREKSLIEREQAVLIQEKSLRLLEDSLKLNNEKIDSLRLTQDQNLLLPDSLAGLWNVQMFCTQTNCSGFAVGDVRKESWEMANSSLGVSVKVMQGQRLIRTYIGKYTGTNIKLALPEADTVSGTKMSVELKLESVGKMSGKRLISQVDGCGATFRVDMDKVNKK